MIFTPLRTTTVPHIDVAIVRLLCECERHVIDVALNWCGVRSGSHKVDRAVVLGFI